MAIKKELTRAQVLDRLRRVGEELHSLTLARLYRKVVGGKIDVTNMSGDHVYLVDDDEGAWLQRAVERMEAQ